MNSSEIMNKIGSLSISSKIYQQFLGLVNNLKFNINIDNNKMQLIKNTIIGIVKDLLSKSMLLYIAKNNAGSFDSEAIDELIKDKCDVLSFIATMLGGNIDPQQIDDAVSMPVYNAFGNVKIDSNTVNELVNKSNSSLANYKVDNDKFVVYVNNEPIVIQNGAVVSIGNNVQNSQKNDEQQQSEQINNQKNNEQQQNQQTNNQEEQKNSESDDASKGIDMVLMLLNSKIYPNYHKVLKTNDVKLAKQTLIDLNNLATNFDKIEKSGGCKNNIDKCNKFKQAKAKILKDLMNIINNNKKQIQKQQSSQQNQQQNQNNQNVKPSTQQQSQQKQNNQQLKNKSNQQQDQQGKDNQQLQQNLNNQRKNWISNAQQKWNNMSTAGKIGTAAGAAAGLAGLYYLYKKWKNR